MRFFSGLLALTIDQKGGQMRQLFVSSAAIIVIFLASHARAQQAEIPGAVAAGTGCPAGTSLIGISKDGKKLTALFDSYMVSVPRGAQNPLARKSCALAIPVKVTKNTRVVVKEILIQNDVNLSKNAKSTFDAEVFFAGSKGTKVSDVVKGAVNHVRTARKTLKVVSDCGHDQILRVNTSLRVEAEPGLAALSGIRDRLELKLALQACK
jgi:hypothetical protein